MMSWRSKFEKNNLLFGLGLGIISPTFCFALIFVVLDLLGNTETSAIDSEGIRTRTIFLVAVCTNIFWIRFYNQAFYSRALKGVMVGTMILSLLWFMKYYPELYAT